MKEIDFLPDWYRNGRRRQIGYHAQYAVLGGVLAVVVVWSLVVAYLASRTSKELAAARSQQEAAELVSQEFARIKEQMTELQEKADIIAMVDSRINVANVLAELSFLIDEKVVLSKVKFIAEKFAEDKGAADRGVGVRVASGTRGGKGDWNGNVRFKVVISGMAVDAGSVADLICRLEDSPYFYQVYPSFSRNSRMKDRVKRPAAGNYQVSEFEINCYLANYRWQEEHLAEEPKPGKGSEQESS